MKKLNLAGCTFGKWTVLEKVEDSRKDSYWLCKCECGTVKSVKGTNLTTNNSTHCKKCTSLTHGDSGAYKRTKLYARWINMKARCNNPNATRYENYGGRGITVCQEWQDSFEAFKEWALANGYEENLQINRIDNDGNYCPENCDWVTNTENLRNQSTTLLTLDSAQECIDLAKTLSISEIAKKLGISYSSVYSCVTGKTWKDAA
jgi:hypothetical protein